MSPVRAVESAVLPPVLVTGSERFMETLSPTEVKKFQGMSALATHYVVAFAGGRRPTVMHLGAHFYLLPNLKTGRIRQVVFLVGVFFLAIYLALFKGMRIAVSQGIYDAVPLIVARSILSTFGLRGAVVVQVHGDWEEPAYLLGKLSRSSSRLIARVAYFVLRRADVVRAISRYTLEMATPHMRKDAKSIVFPAFSDIDLFLGKQEAFPERPRLLFAGVLTSLKGADVLVRAMHMLVEEGRDLELVVAGTGPAEKTLRSQVHDLGLESRIRFAGFVDQAQLQKEMSQAMCLVLPSFSEGLGRVILEAMACARPVIASRVGGTPELITEGVTGLLAGPGDSHDLAQKIRILLDNRTAAEEMGRAARVFIEGSFSSESFFERYADLLELANETRNIGARSDS
ncbi:MAG: glycosyltransferase family 4 protein [Actinomycetota bacterium]